MAAQTAIEYGGHRLRLIEFDGSGRKVRVLAVEEVSLDVATAEDQDPDDVRAAAIAEATKAAGVALDPSAMSIDAGSALFREFDLPFTSDEQIDKVVRFEAEPHFPGDLDEYVVQHTVLRRSRDKSHVLAVAVKKEELLDRLDVLDESGFDPMLVEIDGFALYNALVATGLAATPARCVVVNAQDHATDLLFLVDGRLHGLRSVRIGSHGLGGGPQDELAAARQHEYLQRLSREIRRTLTNLPDLGQVELVRLTGGGGSLPGLSEALGEIFGAPVERLDLLEHVDHKLDEDEAARLGPDLGVAIGLAFKLNGVDALRTDFRREEAAYTRRFDQVKTPLIVFSFLLFLAVAFLGLDAFMRTRRLLGEYDQITRHGGEQLAALLGDDEAAAAKWRGRERGPPQVRALLTAVRDLREDIAQKLGRSQTIPELPSGLAVWIELFELIRENEAALGRFALERLDIDVGSRNKVLTLTGEVEDAARYQTLEEILRAHPMFRNLSSAGTKQTSSGLRFTDLSVQLVLDDAGPAEEG